MTSISNQNFRKHNRPVKLQKTNQKALIALAYHLKGIKFMADKEFKQFILKEKKMNKHNTHYQNFNNIIHNLYYYDLVDQVSINGFVCWSATTKLVYGKRENWFRVPQKVCQSDIKKAVEYQSLNSGLMDTGFEAKIIAERILGLEDQEKKYFINEYITIMECLKMDNMLEYANCAIIYPLKKSYYIEIV